MSGANVVSGVVETHAEVGGATVARRDSRPLALLELAAFALVFLAREHRLVPFSTTLFLLVIPLVSLRVRRLGWRSLGFALYRSWGATLALGVGLGAASEAFQLLVTQPLLSRWLGAQPDLHTFRMLRGNVKLALLGFALIWTLAAFGEEMVYRGYLLNRVADLGRRTAAAWVAAVVLVGFVFGWAHAYQGATGIIEEGIAGLMLTAMYLGTGRNLAVPIVAHGVADTIDLFLVFFGRFPGM